MPTAAIRTWALWRERRRALPLIGLVEGLAIAAPVAGWAPVSKKQLLAAFFLISLSLVYSGCVVTWEKVRRHLLYQHSPAMTPNVQTTWCFAAALLLPPELAGAVAAVCFAGGWAVYNSAGSRRLYRFVYSVLTAGLAATAASWVFRLSLPLQNTLVLAGATWIAIGAGATTLAMLASGDYLAARKMLHLDAHMLVLATAAVAVIEYFASVVALPLIWLSLPAAVAIQRYFVNIELRTREPAARPITAEAWLQIATVVTDASDATTVLRIDTADPQAASMVAMMQGGCDAIGHYPDGGLAVLLLDCPPAQGDSLARRLRLALNHHKIEAYVAAASAPRDGRTLQDLLAVCEAELVLLREAARRSTSA